MDNRSAIARALATWTGKQLYLGRFYSPPAGRSGDNHSGQPDPGAANVVVGICSKAINMLVFGLLTNLGI